MNATPSKRSRSLGSEFLDTERSCVVQYSQAVHDHDLRRIQGDPRGDVRTYARENDGIVFDFIAPLDSSQRRCL